MATAEPCTEDERFWEQVSDRLETRKRDEEEAKEKKRKIQEEAKAEARKEHDEIKERARTTMPKSVRAAIRKARREGFCIVCDRGSELVKSRMRTYLESLLPEGARDRGWDGIYIDPMPAGYSCMARLLESIPEWMVYTIKLDECKITIIVND